MSQEESKAYFESPSSTFDVAEYLKAQREKTGYKYNPQVDRQSYIKRTYGITSEEYRAMLDKQNGACMICGEPEIAKHQNGTIKSLAIDHDHVTGEIRSLLCRKCKMELGLYEKLKPVSAVYEEYLQRYE